MHFSLTEYTNENDEPLVSKTAEIINTGDGNYGAIATLTPSDTLELDGKYIYQFTVIDSHGNAHSERGFAYINKNTNKQVLRNL